MLVIVVLVDIILMVLVIVSFRSPELKMYVADRPTDTLKVKLRDFFS